MQEKKRGFSRVCNCWPLAGVVKEGILKDQHLLRGKKRQSREGVVFPRIEPRCDTLAVEGAIKGEVPLRGLLKIGGNRRRGSYSPGVEEGHPAALVWVRAP